MLVRRYRVEIHTKFVVSNVDSPWDALVAARRTNRGNPTGNNADVNVVATEESSEELDFGLHH